jgi:hypothetical protein
MHIISGLITPLQGHIQCYRQRHKLLVFDDAEVLWATTPGRVMMRAICDSTPVKTLRYASTTRELEHARVPQEFATSSRVAIVANNFLFGKASETAAILDRGHVVFFDPPPIEVHRHAATWFWNQEIFDFIGERLHRARDHSARLYVKADEVMQAGGDWRGYIEESLNDDLPTECVQRLEADSTCPKVSDKIARFIAETGMCRASYFSLRKRLEADGRRAVSDPAMFAGLKVQGHRPVRPDIEAEVARAQQEDAKQHENANPAEEVENWQSSPGAARR